MGAVEGVIMPTIMTVHITNVSANSEAVHGMREGAARFMPGMSAIPGMPGIE
jgi:hypothetical protein